MSIIDFLKNLINKFGEWFADLFAQSEVLYNKLTAEETKAANWAYGVIAIINNNIDKVPSEIITIIQEKYPDLSLVLLHGFLDKLVSDMKFIQGETPVTLADAIALIKTYLSKIDGDVWKTISQGIGSALAALLSPGTPVQKFAAIAEFVYQLFVKPHVETQKAASAPVDGGGLPPDPTHPKP